MSVLGILAATPSCLLTPSYRGLAATSGTEASLQHFSGKWRCTCGIKIDKY